MSSMLGGGSSGGGATGPAGATGATGSTGATGVTGATGAGSITVADSNANTVTGVTTLTFEDETLVAGATPNATVTIHPVQLITTGAAPVNLTEPFADRYIITSGGTQAVETINLPGFAAYADKNVGREIIFAYETATNANDVPTVTYDRAAATTENLSLGSLGYTLGAPVLVTLVCDGKYWIPGTYYNNFSHNVESGYSSSAEGAFNTASGQNSHAEGQATTASGLNCHSEGNATTASGPIASHSEGSNTTASGQYSHAEGDQTIASGFSSHAEGTSTTASNQGAHAEGSGTNATGTWAHAEGSSTTASGQFSHAEGENTTASAEASHAEGLDTVADGLYSHAAGKESTTRTLDSARSLSNRKFSVVGDNNFIEMMLSAEVMETPAVATTDGAAASASNQLTLVDNQTVFVQANCFAKDDISSANYYVRKKEIVATRDTGAGSVVLRSVLSRSFVFGGNGPMWTISISADTTNGAISFTVTGSGDLTRWNVHIFSQELVLPIPT